VAICARRKDATDSAAAAIAQAYGNEPRAIVADITTAEGCARAVDATLEAFGRIDTLVINAGPPQRGNFADLDDEAWRRAIDMFFFPSIRLIRRALPALRTSAGSIVVSTAASLRQPGVYPDWVTSVATRGAVHGLLKGLVRDTADAGVRVNAVMPGTFATERVVREDGDMYVGTIPLGRYGRPEEFAAVVAFVASKRAGFVNGASIVVDGGETTAVY